VRRLSRHAQRLQAFGAAALWNCIRDIGDSLRGLSDRHLGDHLVGQRVDGRQAVGILQSDIDALSIAGRPDAMRQFANRDGGNR